MLKPEALSMSVVYAATEGHVGFNGTAVLGATELPSEAVLIVLLLRPMIAAWWSLLQPRAVLMVCTVTRQCGWSVVHVNTRGQVNVYPQSALLLTVKGKEASFAVVSTCRLKMENGRHEGFCDNLSPYLDNPQKKQFR